jgi:hypothetical protein
LLCLCVTDAGLFCLQYGCHEVPSVWHAG